MEPDLILMPLKQKHLLTAYITGGNGGDIRVHYTETFRPVRNWYIITFNIPCNTSPGIVSKREKTIMEQASCISGLNCIKYKSNLSKPFSTLKSKIPYCTTRQAVQYLRVCEPHKTGLTQGRWSRLLRTLVHCCDSGA